MRLYHGTRKETVDDILRNGLEIFDSGEMFFGRGLYLAKTLEQALEYGDTILAVYIPDDLWEHRCRAMQMEGIGTYFQFLDEQGIRDSTDESWDEYVDLAKSEQESALSDGCKIRESRTQVVIHDPAILLHLKVSVASARRRPARLRRRPGLVRVCPYRRRR